MTVNAIPLLALPSVEMSQQEQEEDPYGMMIRSLYGMSPLEIGHDMPWQVILLWGVYGSWTMR